MSATYPTQADNLKNKKPSCTVEGCDRPHKGRGYCNTHYTAWRRGRELRPIGDRTERLCTVDGCDRKHEAKGMCKWHYNKFSDTAPKKTREKPQFKFIKGKTYSHLTTLSQGEPFKTKSGQEHPTWVLRCRCGNEIVRLAEWVHTYRVHSCGCVPVPEVRFNQRKIDV